MVRAAVARRNNGNIDGALEFYAEVLDRSPKVAIAHLDAAIIFHDYKKDYLRAIYHYERYLELRPTAEKKKLIEDRIRLAGQSYAAKLAADGSTVAELGRLSIAFTDLKKENDALKSTVSQLNLQVEQISRKPVAVVVPVQKPKPAVPMIMDDAPARLPETVSAAGRVKDKVVERAVSGDGALGVKLGTVRTYTVKKGDTLRGIAYQCYRSAEKAEAIFQANRDKLGSKDGLKAGQVLTLP